MSLVKIPDSSLVRDTNSKALLNTDRNALQEYYTKREIAKKQQCEQIETKVRLAKLEEDMTEIKSLLIEIAQMRKV